VDATAIAPIDLVKLTATTVTDLKIKIKLNIRLIQITCG